VEAPAAIPPYKSISHTSMASTASQPIAQTKALRRSSINFGAKKTATRAVFFSKALSIT
jgi:hypothetical protein